MQMTGVSIFAFIALLSAYISYKVALYLFGADNYHPDLYVVVIFISIFTIFMSSKFSS